MWIYLMVMVLVYVNVFNGNGIGVFNVYGNIYWIWWLRMVLVGWFNVGIRNGICIFI